MKTDLYTKTVLTAIAFSLMAIALQHISLIGEANAGVGSSTANYGLVPLNEDGSITVRLSDHDQVNVNIADITTTDELDINIDEVGGSYLSSGGPLLVKIKE